MDLRPHSLGVRCSVFGVRCSDRRSRTPHPEHRTPFLRILALIAGLLAVAIPRALAQTGPNREYRIKAACIYNFVKFVEWPAQASGDSVGVCVLGKEAYEAAYGTIHGKSVAGKTLVVRPFTGVRDLRNCQILFISDAERDQWKAILGAVGNASILTVGESEGFARSGGIISFSRQSNKLRFEINPAAADRAGLQISSQLMKLSR